jgi:methyl coenzyme M reductase subunit D
VVEAFIRKIYRTLATPGKINERHADPFTRNSKIVVDFMRFEAQESIKKKTRELLIVVNAKSRIGKLIMHPRGDLL